MFHVPQPQFLVKIYLNHCMRDLRTRNHNIFTNLRIKTTFENVLSKTNFNKKMYIFNEPYKIYPRKEII